MHAVVAAKARVGAPAPMLLARAGAVWLWPGVPLTERRGGSVAPIAPELARFWISRLHGPEANDVAALRRLAVAAQKLNAGDEASAQRALDACGLSRLSPPLAGYPPASICGARAGMLDERWALMRLLMLRVLKP